MLSTSDELASKTVKLAKEIAAAGIIPDGSRDSTGIPPKALAPPFGPAFATDIAAPVARLLASACLAMGRNAPPTVSSPGPTCTTSSTARWIAVAHRVPAGQHPARLLLVEPGQVEAKAVVARSGQLQGQQPLIPGAPLVRPVAREAARPRLLRGQAPCPMDRHQPQPPPLRCRPARVPDDDHPVPVHHDRLPEPVSLDRGRHLRHRLAIPTGVALVRNDRLGGYQLDRVSACLYRLWITARPFAWSANKCLFNHNRSRKTEQTQGLTFLSLAHLCSIRD
jgi:hypothetical protein